MCTGIDCRVAFYSQGMEPEMLSNLHISWFSGISQFGMEGADSTFSDYLLRAQTQFLLL